MTDRIEPTYCECDYPTAASVASVDGGLRHVGGCGLVVACEFSYMDDGPAHTATVTHVDYLVCDRHLSAAVDNVASRG